MKLVSLGLLTPRRLSQFRHLNNNSAMIYCKRGNQNGRRSANQKQHFETRFNVPKQVSTFYVTRCSALNMFRSVVAYKFQLKFSTCNSSLEAFNLKLTKQMCTNRRLSVASKSFYHARGSPQNAYKKFCI